MKFVGRESEIETRESGLRFGIRSSRFEIENRGSGIRDLRTEGQMP